MKHITTYIKCILVTENNVGIFLQTPFFRIAESVNLLNEPQLLMQRSTTQTCCRRYERVRCYSEVLWGKSPDTGQRLPWRSANVAGSNSRAVKGREAWSYGWAARLDYGVRHRHRNAGGMRSWTVMLAIRTGITRVVLRILTFFLLLSSVPLL